MPSQAWSMENRAKKTMVILRGTSSTGKSTICGILETQHQGWQYMSEDDITWDGEIEYWKQLFPKEHASILNAIAYENVYHAIKRYQIIFKEGISEEAKNNALQAMQVIRDFFNRNPEKAREGHDQRFQIKFFNDIELASNRDLNIIVESWGRVDSLLDQLGERFTMCYILVYAPLHVVFDRTLERNAQSLEIGNLRPNRLFVHTLRGFNRRFVVSQEPEDAIDTIKKEDLEAFDRVEHYLSQLAFPYQEVLSFTQRDLTLSEFEEMKKGIIVNLDKEMYIVPKLSYDLLIYANNKTPENCVQEILDYLSTKQLI